MPTCSAGHRSATTDYCDECGAPMGIVASPPAPPAGASSADSAPRHAPPPAVRRCAVCHTELDARFCEACGHDSTQPAPQSSSRPSPSSPGARGGTTAVDRWSLVATADRTWFEEVCAREGPDIATVQFPHYCPPRTFPLVAPQMTIGRRSRSRGIDPEIDLSGPPLDPGVSSLHAMLLPGPDGGWDLIDIGSVNGTIVNGSSDPIVPHVAVHLAAGDRIKIGAWTLLTVTVARIP